MTDASNSPLLAVIPIDRDAAADATRANHTRYPWSFADRMRAGELDYHPLVQAFAAHRLAAEAGQRQAKQHKD